MKYFKFILASIMMMSLSTVVTPVNAAWNHDGYGYVSNFCRAGYYWQFVPWDYVGTSCYMPMHGLWGKRVAE